MAGKYGPNYTPSWGIGLLFVGFLILTLIWEKLLHAIEHALKKRNKHGLLKVLHKLLEEILAVGLIVLLLPLFENHLQKVCVPMKWYKKAPGYTDGSWFPSTADSAGYYPVQYNSTDSYGSAYNTSGSYGSAGYNTTNSYASKYGGTAGYNTTGGYSGRHLLAPPKSDKPKCPDGTYKSDVCNCGYTQLYPVDAIHGIHIFIALTAIVHIIYAGVSMVLCLWRVKRWQRWEAEAIKSPLVCISPTVIKSLGRSNCMHCLTALFNQFFLPVSQSMYAGLRRLTVEQLKQHGGTSVLPVDFPFFEYMKEAMETSFSKVVGVSPVVWFFAVIQLMVPIQWRVWSVVVLCVITIILMIVAGAKLHSVVVHLAARAHFLYGEESLQEHAAMAIDKGKVPSRLNTKVFAAGNFPPLADTLSVDDDAKDQAAKPGGVLPKAMEWVGDDKNPKLGQMNKNLQANFVKKFKSFDKRALLDEDLPSLFWFHKPRLLLWFYKLAYFQSAFCATLVLFACWKDNQFLPPKENKAQVYAFAIAFALNLLLSFFQSTCVLPVYALVSITDKNSLPAAAKFLERTLTFEEQMSAAHGQADAAAALDQAEHQQMREALQKLSSHARHMATLAEEAREGLGYGPGGLRDNLRGPHAV